MKDATTHPSLVWPMTEWPCLEGMKKITVRWRDTVSRWTNTEDMIMVMILASIIMHIPKK